MAAHRAIAGGQLEVFDRAGHLPHRSDPTRFVTVLARLAARGVPFTTASDAHHLSHVADRVGDLYALLTSVGVDRLTGYRRRQAHTLALTEPLPLLDALEDGAQ